jgi:hypothetical protein
MLADKPLVPTRTSDASWVAAQRRRWTWRATIVGCCNNELKGRELCELLYDDVGDGSSPA